MKKINYIGITAGCVSGLIGAVLVSSFDFSLFSVGVIGLIVGTLTGWIFSLFK
jgi:tetrahydromethanopterin S-methyltransferase subunit C